MFWKTETENLEKFYHFIMEHRPIIVYDTETTGRSSKVDRIVEFSANRYEVVDGIYQLAASIDLYMKPPFHMSQYVIDIHGITNEFLEDKPSEKDVFETIRNFLSYPEAVICGYNNEKFDDKFLEEMYCRYGLHFPEVPMEFADIYKIAKELISPSDMKETLSKRENNDIEGKDLYSLRLSNVIAYYGIEQQFGFHTASEDIQATWMAGIHMLKDFKNKFRIEKGISVCWNERESVRIIKMDQFKMSSLVNRIYVTILRESGKKDRIYYDVRAKGWMDETSRIMNEVNMKKIAEDADTISRKMGFAGIDKFSGNAEGVSVCLN